MRCSGRQWHRMVARAGVASALLTLGGMQSEGLALAAATPLQECINRKVGDGVPLPTATAECVKEMGPASATTTRPAADEADEDRDDERDDDNDRPAVSSEDGGTSVGALLAVGAGGLVVGAGAAALLLRRRPAAAAPSPFVAPGAGAPPQPPGPPPGSPLAAPPGAAPATATAANDRGPTLIVALVDLADRVNSQALRADILAALARAGVHQIEIAAGEPFDANRMRGVGSAPTADPSLVGRVAATDRPGFRDGTQVIRLPDVVVHVAG